jgi:DNA-binding response OmpR family regulator
MKRILVVDDDLELCKLLKECMDNQKYCIETIHNGEEAIPVLEKGSYDLVILDIMLPGLDGLNVLHRLREKSNIPVIILSAKGNEMDRVVGLRSGADDYLCKPFSLSELIARVDNLIDRFALLHGKVENDTTLLFENLEADTEKCIVSKNNEPIDLTAKEYKLLCLFMRNPNRVFTKKQIYQDVWDESFLYDDGTVMTLIRRLRKKIEDDPVDPYYIQTVWGIGYRLGRGR